MDLEFGTVQQLYGFGDRVVMESSGEAGNVFGVLENASPFNNVQACVYFALLMADPGKLVRGFDQLVRMDLDLFAANTDSFGVQLKPVLVLVNILERGAACGAIPGRPSGNGTAALAGWLGAVRSVVGLLVLQRAAVVLRPLKVTVPGGNNQWRTLEPDNMGELVAQTYAMLIFIRELHVQQADVGRNQQGLLNLADKFRRLRPEFGFVLGVRKVDGPDDFTVLSHFGVRVQIHRLAAAQCDAVLADRTDACKKVFSIHPMKNADDVPAQFKHAFVCIAIAIFKPV